MFDEDYFDMYKLIKENLDNKDYKNMLKLIKENLDNEQFLDIIIEDNFSFRDLITDNDNDFCVDYLDNLFKLGIKKDYLFVDFNIGSFIFFNKNKKYIKDFPGLLSFTDFIIFNNNIINEKGIYHFHDTHYIFFFDDFIDLIIDIDFENDILLWIDFLLGFSIYPLLEYIKNIKDINIKRDFNYVLYNTKDLLPILIQNIYTNSVSNYVNLDIYIDGDNKKAVILDYLQFVNVNKELLKHILYFHIYISKENLLLLKKFKVEGIDKIIAGKKIVKYIENAMDDSREIKPLRLKIDLKKHLNLINN